MGGRVPPRTGNTIWGGNVEREGRLKLKSVAGEYQCRAERITDPSLYSTEATEIGRSVEVQATNGKAVSQTVPPAGFVVYR
jgi:hypothetical protein